MAERERIEFMPEVIAAGIVPSVDYCEETEKVVVEPGWAHVILCGTFTDGSPLRSYPSHVISRVVHSD